MEQSKQPKEQPKQIEFTAFPRETEGRGASRRLRRSGRAPAIVYGGTNEPEPIELDHNALFHALKKESFHSSILTMKLGQASQRVLLRDVQMHPFKNEILHVDFQRVDENRKIHMKVPLHFTNSDLSPAVKTTDAIISHVMTELDVACLPKDLPGFVEVDLSQLAVGQSIHVTVTTGALLFTVAGAVGVTAVTRPGASPVVATAIVPRVVAEVEEAAPTAEAAAGDAAADAAKPGEKAGDKAGDKGGDKAAAKAPAKKDDKK